MNRLQRCFAYGKRIRIVLLLAVLLVAGSAAFEKTAGAASADSIPAGAVVWHGHSYYLYKKGSSWPEARRACEKVGGHLVTITSEGENSVVSKLAAKLPSNGQDVWIGLWRSSENESWKWVTGEKLKYTNWRHDRGTDADTGYVSLSNYPADPDFSPEESGTWASWWDTDLMFYYVCEWDREPDPDPAPQNLKARQTGLSQIRLTWVAGKNAKSYAIYRKAGQGSYVKIGTARKLTYTDKTVKKGKKYQYKVQAVNGKKTAFSSPVSAVPMAKPASLKAKSDGQGRTTLRWKKVAGATKYKVYQKGPGDSSYFRVSTVKENRVVLDLNGSPDGLYEFYVVPLAGSFQGLKSGSVSVRVSFTAD